MSGIHAEPTATTRDNNGMSEFDVNVPATPDTPSPSDIGAPSGQPDPTPQVTPQSATPTVNTQPPATPGGGQPPQGYVPSYRLREAREAAERAADQKYAQQIAQVRAEAERYRQQLHSVVGATPQQVNPEIEAIRNQFANVFPDEWKLLQQLKERAESIFGIADRAGELEQSTNHYWTSYGRQTVDRLFNIAEESMGGPLNDEAKRQLFTSFTGFVQSSPEMQERYANDPTIVEDFWRAFTSSFIDPVRRNAVTNTVGRAPQALPQDAPSGAPRISPVPKPQSLDERASIAWQSFQQSKQR